MPSQAFQTCYEETLSILTKDTEGNTERLLQEILAWEDSHPRRNKYDGFEWHNIHGDARTLNSLVTRGILDIVFKSNKSCIYKVSNRRALKKALSEYRGSLASEKDIVKEIPENLFDIIVGHEHKKELIRRSIKSSDPVHAILFGSPASAKTLMLEELARLPNSHFILGSSLTKAGLFEILFTERPTYLILDELDKIDDTQNLAALLSLMERGWVSESKHRRHRKIRLKCWVFASANDIKKIPRELLSRFMMLKFKDYSDAEFVDISVRVLKEREGVSERYSLFIADEILKKLQSRDVRDCVRVARLLKGRSKKEISFLVDILKRQK